MSQSPFPPNHYGSQPGNPGIPSPYGQGQPGPYPGTAYPPSPYGTPGFPQQFRPPPTSSGRSVLWILGILGGLMFFCCAGCGGFSVWALYFVAGTEAELVKASLEKSPKASEELGTPIDVKWNMGKSFGEDDNDIFVFDVSGPKGKGIVRADCDASDEEIYECYLEVNGKTIDVLADENLTEMEESAIDDLDITPIEK